MKCTRWRPVRTMLALVSVLLVASSCGGGVGSSTTTGAGSTTTSAATASTSTTTSLVAAACPGIPGDPDIPAGAIEISSITGDFDGDGVVDQFAVYGDGGVWYAHFIFDYGYGARVAIDATALLIDPPGTGFTFVKADMTYGASDMNGDGVDEAWVYNNGPASNDVVSAFVYSTVNCLPYHVSHHDLAAGPVTWLRGASVGSGENGLCFISGGVIEWHVPGTSGGSELYREHSFSHQPLVSEIGEFYGVGVLSASQIPAACGVPTTGTGGTATPGEYCVTDIAWNDTLNVRTGPGVTFSIIGTLPFHGVGVNSTGNTGTDPNGTWFEIAFAGGTGWVASWYLTPAPCGPLVDHDVTLDLVLDGVVEFDPMEPPPANQTLGCGEGGLCHQNSSITDRSTIILSPSVEVWLLSAVDLSTPLVVTIVEFEDYLSGAGYDPALHFTEASYPCSGSCAKPTVGNPYQIYVQNGEVIRIEQLYLP